MLSNVDMQTFHHPLFHFWDFQKEHPDVKNNPGTMHRKVFKWNLKNSGGM